MKGCKLYIFAKFLLIVYQHLLYHNSSLVFSRHIISYYIISYYIKPWLQLSDLVQWIQDILHSTSFITDSSSGSNSDGKIEERANSIASDGKEDSSRDITHQVDGKSIDNDDTIDNSQSSSPIPYRIEYANQVVQSVIPTIIIHYAVPKEL